MEKHKCKLCFRNFSNGRALGGHMRSHMMNLQVPPKPNESPPMVQLSFEAESASSQSSFSSAGEEENKGLNYELRENPKRSLRISDPEFSFAAAADTGSVILQDRESETESSKNVTRRRSKRAWKLSEFNEINNEKKMRPSQLSNRNESASSVSDTTTEEDVAFCLMMLSRDSRDSSNWKLKIHHNNKQEVSEQEDEYENEEEDEEEEEEEEEEDEDEDEEEEEESDGYEELKKSLKSMTTTTKKVRGRYKCDTCHKVFRSYQALGGHRASHKKIKVVVDHHRHEPQSTDHDDDDNVNNNNNNSKNNNNNHNNRIIASSSSFIPVTTTYNNGNNSNNLKKKIHECPVCFRVFASGQALGGHKRTHVTNVAAAATRAEESIVATSRNNSAKIGRGSFIDLNLPAPLDDDDASQFEYSAVSDAEFVKKVKILPR